VTRPAWETPLDRFESKVIPEPNTGCWLWVGATDRNGYGSFRGEKPLINVKPHRWSYEHFVGPIPEGLTLDHKCETPQCVNPAHLQPVTLRENILRGSTNASAVNARRSLCVHGHRLVPSPFPSESGRRRCMQCLKTHAQTSRLRRAQ
jgi:hypothetical protein